MLKREYFALLESNNTILNCFPNSFFFLLIVLSSLLIVLSVIDCPSDGYSYSNSTAKKAIGAGEAQMQHPWYIVAHSQIVTLG